MGPDSVMDKEKDAMENGLSEEEEENNIDHYNNSEEGAAAVENGEIETTTTITSLIECGKDLATLEKEEHEIVKQKFAGGECFAGKKRKKEKNGKKKAKRSSIEDSHWDCPECTYKNKSEDFKCEMCYASKVTSKGRRTRRDPTIVQERVQQAMRDEEEAMADPKPFINIKPHFMVTPVKPPIVKQEFTEGEMKERFQCDQCDAHFSAPGNLARHKLSKHQGIRFSCDVCGAEFTAQGNLKKHKLTEHLGVRFVCDQCGAEFTAQGNLRRHKLSKHEQVRWECDMCKSTFTDQGNLRRHKLTKHEGATYDCYQCPAQFGNHGTLRRHILTEHEGVRHDCDLCEAQFSDQGNLKRHKMTKHEGIKYKCDLCDEEFMEQGNLKRHKLSKHDGVRYDCDKCEARFYEESQLQKHKLTKHEGVKLEGGGEAGGAKPYSCQICGFKCTKKPNLRSHIKRRHCSETLSLKDLEEMYPDMYKYHGSGQPPLDESQKRPMMAPNGSAGGGLIGQHQPADMSNKFNSTLPNGVHSSNVGMVNFPTTNQPKQEQGFVAVPPPTSPPQPEHSTASNTGGGQVGGGGGWGLHTQNLGQTGMMAQSTNHMQGMVGHMATQHMAAGQMPSQMAAVPMAAGAGKYLSTGQHTTTANHGAKFLHEQRYIPGEQERLMQEQQQRLAMAGLMEYCNQVGTVMPGMDQNERYLLEQRERERREREQRERYSLSSSWGQGMLGATHGLPQVAPLDMRDRMFQQDQTHALDARLAPDRLASSALTEMYQRMYRTSNQ